MAVPESLKKVFLAYLLTKPPCLFVWNKDMTCECLDDLFKEAEQAQTTREALRVLFKGFRRSPTGTLALFPSYLAFFTKGDKERFPWGEIVIKGTVGSLAGSVLDLYEGAELLVDAGKTAISGTAWAKQLKIDDFRQMLAAPTAYVWPVGGIESLEKDGNGVWLKTATGSMFWLIPALNRGGMRPWRRQLIKAWQQAKG
ncbi:MAG: hypothetical protein Kow00124_21470 [Anaerolineae bacterium]